MRRDDETPAVVGAHPPTASADVTLGALFRLAWPTVLARAGVLIMALVDIVMVGRLGAEEVAIASLGNSMFIPLLVAGIGLVIGVMVLSAQAHGAGRPEEARAVLLRGLPWALAVGTVGALICAASPLLLRLLGHAPALAEGAGRVAQALAIGIPAQLLYVVCAFGLEAARKPKPALVAMLAANLVNAGLNWVLIYGNLGAPALGAVGSAIATATVRVFLFAALASYILWSDHLGLRAALRAPIGSVWGPGGWAAAAPMRKIGYAAGASTSIETTAFAAMMQFAGWLGPLSLAAFAIAANLEALVYMAALGLSSSAAVFVGGAFGRGDPEGARRAAAVGLRAVVLVTGACAAVTALAAPTLAGLYTSDPALAAAAAALLPWIGLVMILDGAQLLMAASVRAAGDGFAATRRFVVAYWGVSAPLGWFLAHGLPMLGAEGFGPFGLVLGGLAGVASSFVLQSARFRALVRSGRTMAAAGVMEPETSARARRPDGAPTKGRVARPGWRGKLVERLELGLFRAVVGLLSPIPKASRPGVAAALAGAIGPSTPFVRRIDANLDRVRPALDRSARRAIRRGVMANFARLAVEYQDLEGLAARAPGFAVEGLEHLHAARAAAGGRLVVVSAHLGNWEAIRAVAALHGAPLGIIYRAPNNRLIDDAIHERIVAAGWPAFRKGREGARALFARVRGGGGVLILVDQRLGGAPVLDFMGRPAETSIAPAQLARQLGAPLLPAVAWREGESFRVRFEEPIAPAAPPEMMQAVNDRIAAWVDAWPAQWFWLHRRWKIRGDLDADRKFARRAPADEPQPTSREA